MTAPTPTEKEESLRIGVDLRALVPAPTGIGVYTRSLLRSLTTLGPHRYVGLSHQPPRRKEELEAMGVEIDRPLRAPLGVAWQQLRLPSRLARGDLQLFWSPLGILPLLSAVPTVVTVHDLTPVLLPETHSLKNRWSQIPFLRATLRKATRIVAISQATADDLERFAPGCMERVSVVHNGVDPEFRPGEGEAITGLRGELDCPQGYILYAGTLEPRKNIGLLLDAWERLRGTDGDTLPLVIAGPYGWRSQNLMRRLEELERRCAGDGGPPLLIRGRLERGELLALFQAARIFAFPSLYEGFGLPPAEAMACGVPVVVSDRSSLPEVVGRAGLQVPADDAEALAGALRRLSSDEALVAELREAGLRRAAQLTWEAAAQGMTAVFRQAVRLE